MIVMPSNNTGFDCGVLFGRYPGRLGHLHSVEAPREPRRGFPWALDNGVYGAFTSKREWDESPFYRYLDEYAAWKPRWAVVPDAVGDRGRTLKLWECHAPIVASYGVPLAMAVQNGMTPEDVPSECAVVFVGGTTSWKWRNLRMWTAAFPRVHVGRVNSLALLQRAEAAGAESCDGTGWFRDPRRTEELEAFLKGVTPHPELELCH